MEPVVYDDTPLADYLRDEGDESEADWAAAAESAPSCSSSPPSPTSTSSSPPSSPLPFAPTGRPLVKARFRGKVPASQPPSASTLRAIRRSCSAALVASIDGSDNSKFLEQFRYTIIASQLLSGHSILGHRPVTARPDPSTVAPQDPFFLSVNGLFALILTALAIALFLSWVRSGSALPHYTRKRLIVVLAISAAVAFLVHVYLKRQWLRYHRDQCLHQMTAFVSGSRDFDSATEATLSLVQEVELVSRGYRIASLPPISRLEDRSQNRKCIRLRKTLNTAFGHLLASYSQAFNNIKDFSEQIELEKYYDMYDISHIDMSDALQGYSETEFEDLESLRTLKILAARFHTTRKMILCGLLALNADGDAAELQRWSAALAALHGLNVSTETSYRDVRAVLSEEESFPIPPSPQGPLTPGRERWWSQLRKLNPLSTGIRGLQAKLHLLKEESDRVLNHSDDISELGPNLMSQYEAIGVDLKELMAAWEDGKAALALGIDRNEKRLSSMSVMPSSTSSLSGLTTVEEGDAAVALKLLTGDILPPAELVEPETPEVFEAVARPRPRSLLTRERLIRMREEREQKAQARQQMDATRGMLRELESVINLRPRVRASPPASGVRIVSV